METLAVHRPDDLGPALREVRLERGVSQSALASDAGVGRQWLNAFEMGYKWTAPLDMVMRVAAALAVTMVLEPASPAWDEDGNDGEPEIDLNDVLNQVMR
ncbi:MAG: helix-turn-helix domain-containing protein [Mycobacteriaceae bacterium]|uniref:helix-turn-helix domain-containing protein n=1 Tax=Corynebacterium sp. TaxID=1720 RepID=UPI003F9677EE